MLSLFAVNTHSFLNKTERRLHHQKIETTTFWLQNYEGFPISTIESEKLQLYEVIQTIP